MPSTKGGVRQIWRWLDAGAGDGGTDMLTLSKCITDVLQAVMCLEAHNNGPKYNNSGAARAIRGRSRCINGVRNPGGRAKRRGGGGGSRVQDMDGKVQGKRGGRTQRYCRGCN